MTTMNDELHEQPASDQNDSFLLTLQILLNLSVLILIMISLCEAVKDVHFWIHLLTSRSLSINEYFSFFHCPNLVTQKTSTSYGSLVQETSRADQYAISSTMVIYLSVF